MAEIEILTERTKVTKEVTHFANLFCDGKIVSTLEGGYNTKALAESAGFHVQALVEANG